MIIFTVISYSTTNMYMSVPVIHFFSLDKEKCKTFITEKDEKSKFHKGSWKLIELESDKDLEYLIGMVY